MSEPKVIVADDGDQVSLKLKDLIQGEADKVLQSSDTATLVIGLSGKLAFYNCYQVWLLSFEVV